MIKSVVVPLDGSELAESALGYAVPIALQHDAPIHLVYVIHHDAEASEDDDARSYLASVKERLSGTVETHVRLGTPADEIIDVADDSDESLVVMTTHGRTGIGRWIYGSVADKVVHAAESPVLLIRSGTGKPGEATISKIVLSLDGSAYSEAALPFAKSLARTFEAELHVVRVAETANLYSTLGYESYAPGSAQPMTDIVEMMVADCKKYISSVTKSLRDEGFIVHGVVLEGFAGEELLQYEHKVEPDLMVMATRGRSGFQRFIFGSVAERVLKMGRTPVLMVKPSGDLDEGE
jgi:nucleotide-binding universal stress UspA family protein